jgi:hypothetical protein
MDRTQVANPRLLGQPQADPFGAITNGAPNVGGGDSMAGLEALTRGGGQPLVPDVTNAPGQAEAPPNPWYAAHQDPAVMAARGAGGPTRGDVAPPAFDMGASPDPATIAARMGSDPSRVPAALPAADPTGGDPMVGQGPPMPTMRRHGRRTSMQGGGGMQGAPSLQGLHALIGGQGY